MLITNIEASICHRPLERPFGWSNGWISARVVGLLKIETDEGITGWARAMSAREATSSSNSLATSS